MIMPIYEERAVGSSSLWAGICIYIFLRCCCRKFFLPKKCPKQQQQNIYPQKATENCKINAL